MSRTYALLDHPDWLLYVEKTNEAGLISGAFESRTTFMMTKAAMMPPPHIRQSHGDRLTGALTTKPQKMRTAQQTPSSCGVLGSKLMWCSVTVPVIMLATCHVMTICSLPFCQLGIKRAS